MRIQSCFVDETGRQGMEDGHYLLTLVLHDQSISIEPRIAAYEARLAYEGLRDVPFHAVDLLHGRERYANETAATRKRLLVAFSMFVRTLPIEYHTFRYSRDDARDKGGLQTRMRRDLVNFVFDFLPKFQAFDRVAIYYDGGHAAVTAALREAFDYALARNAAEYKPLSHVDKRLAQTADYLCSIELAAMRYEQAAVSATYARFYGASRNFKQNFLKQARRKRIGRP